MNYKLIENKFDNWIDNFLNFNNLDRSFLINNYEMDRDLYKLKDVEKAAEYIVTYIYADKRILLVTDYDCDGINSAIVLTKYFKDILQYHNCETIVNRRKKGNGINDTLLAEILEKDSLIKVDLIITADHGSTNDEAYKILKEKNIDVIVTDHHEVPKELEYAHAFVNVMREGSEYFKGTSGCHVAFLLCVAITKKLEKDLSILNKLLPYVGISTVVDQMPMNNKHNRNVVKTGMSIINRSRDINFEIFKKKMRLGYLLRSKDIGFKIGPFFNSGNRTNMEEEIFQAFTDKDENKVEDLISLGLLFNGRRKDEQRKMTGELEEQLHNVYPDLNETFGVALVLKSIYGIAGPIASQIGANIYKPIVIFKENGYDDTILSGSGRAIIDLDILETIKELQEEYPEVIIKCGGHSKAFGVDIYKSKLDKFREIFSNKIKSKVNGVIPEHFYNIVKYLEPSDIGLDLYYQIEELGPYGNSYEEPLFISELEYDGHFNIGSGANIKFKKNKKSNISGIFFFSGKLSRDEFEANISIGKKCKVIYSLTLNSLFTTESLRYVTALDIKEIEII